MADVQDVDVIVVGAGPAGNNTALGLAQMGYGVTVIDWRRDVGDKLCTGIVGQECIRRFPIDPSFIHREVASVQAVTPFGGDVRFEAATPQARIIDRVAYVASFANRARDAGAGYLLGQRVSAIEPDKHGVTVVTGEGKHRARAVVLAAGFGSPLTRQLGFGAVTDHVTGVQAVACARDVDEVQVYLGRDVAPGFFAWLVPTHGGRALVGLLARRHAQAHLAAFVGRLESEGKIQGIIGTSSSWGLPLRPLKRTFRDRVLVVGDAAGQVKPTSGGGIFYSLLASEIAAKALGGALADDDLSAANLSQYQTEWKSLLARELEIGYSARRLYEYMSDRQVSSLVQQAGSKGICSDLTGGPDMSFDWHSRIIARVMGHPALGSGLRLINPLLARLACRPDPTLAAQPVNSSLPTQVADLPD
ncbi:MAG: NAD(P)/FAD-dependent oxidoreductase [Chloroflexi bacterium]|nr:NAD(P)/FAD-dependent oxidoreductase [Chloroflexota bacterium]